jgi:hypothetical protein
MEVEARLAERSSLLFCVRLLNAAEMFFDVKLKRICEDSEDAVKVDDVVVEVSVSAEGK